MKNWQDITLGELVTFQRGHDLPESARELGLVPVVGSAGINGYHNKVKAKGPCVTVGRSGASIGKAFYIDQDFWPHNAALYVKDFKGNAPKFVYYYLSLLDFSYLNSGSAQPSLNRNILHKLKINVPCPESQKKIAAILSAYDDLIENNKRRIALLENMAEEIYREWFVRFRFPNYKNAEFEKGIPKGWEVVELKEIAIESSKSTKAGEHLAHRLYLPLDNMGSKQFLPLDHYPYTDAQSSLVTFERGEFIFGAMRPYQHKVVIAPFDGITRTTCFVIKPAQDYLYSYLYLTLFKKSTIDHAMLISNGSDRPYTVWSRGMENMGVIRPDDCTLKSFEKIARPILDSVVSYYFLQRKLEETKNTLLPRLISGKLTVENLNIQFPPSMVEAT